MDYATHMDDQFHRKPRANLSSSNSMSRPSSKTIYEKRKEYSDIMASDPITLKQRVEHLLTCKLGSGTIHEPKDVISKLQLMDAQGQVWGQNVLLQVQDDWLQILDIETREEMDSYPLEGIQSLEVILNSCSYNSVLLIILQGLGHSFASIILFQCWEVKAEILKNHLQKAINELKERQEPRSRFGGSQLSQNRWEAAPQEKSPWNPTAHRRPLSRQPSSQELQRSGQFPQQKAQPEHPPDLDNNLEELNKTLSDIDMFVTMASNDQRNNSKKLLRKKKKTQKESLSDAQYIVCFQNIKHAFNLVGILELHLQQPSAPDLVHMLFQALNKVMSSSPHPHLAASIDVPRLTPKAIALLQSCLTPNEMHFWESLGEFWTTSTANGADQKPANSTAAYEGWEPSKFSPGNPQHDPTKDQDRFSLSPSPAQQPLFMQVQYEFESRNPRELSVVQGEVLEILDQRKQWWLAKNEAGQKGYIPNNILEPLPPGLSRTSSQSSSPVQGPVLRPTSKPHEVRDWLMSENFSTITVKSLGVLTGAQLMHMQPRELQLVCPEEAPRILARLEGVKRTLGMIP